MKTADESPRLPSRRAFLALGVGAFVIGAAPLARRRQRALIRRALPVMGTIAELGVVHRDARFAHGALDAAVAELVRVEQSMSRFLADSDVGRVNRVTAGQPVHVAQSTAAVLAAALHYARGTDGSFDPCLGHVVELWDVKHRRTPPAAHELRRFAGRKLYRKLEVERAGAHHVVVRHETDLAVDLGGIAKGYGVDRAIAALRAWGITDGLVNVGGDLYALGVAQDGDPWEVGVQSPANAGQLSTVLRISDRGVATSGDYLQYFDHSGRRYHHLLDPTTGEPWHGKTHSLTVAADDCMTADAAATAVFGVLQSDRSALLTRVAPGAEVLHQA